MQEAIIPIPHQTMPEIGATRQYQALDEKREAISFADQMHFDLDRYVTDKAWDGLFLMRVHEERKIRPNPAARVIDLLERAFGRQ